MSVASFGVSNHASADMAAFLAPETLGCSQKLSESGSEGFKAERSVADFFPWRVLLLPMVHTSQGEWGLLERHV